MKAIILRLSRMSQKIIKLNKKIMKGKYLLGGLFMAVLGAAIALFAYTRIIEKPAASYFKG